MERTLAGAAKGQRTRSDTQKAVLLTHSVHASLAARCLHGCRSRILRESSLSVCALRRVGWDSRPASYSGVDESKLERLPA